MAEAAAAPLVFNPFDPAFHDNPYPFYRRFREEDPAHYSELASITVLSKYADCAALLRDHRASSDQTRTEAFREGLVTQGMDPDQVLAEMTRPFLFMDPPDHTRLRGLVNKAFTPRVVETMKPRIKQIVDSLLDAAEKRGEIDVVSDLAFPLPVAMICELLGVPPEDVDRFRAWSAVGARSLDPDFVLPPEEVSRREQSFTEFSDYFRELIAARRKDLRDDVLSALIAAENEGDKLTENELIATGILLLIAGHETTVNLIGNGMLALLRSPDQRRRLHDDPLLIATAVEELLRFDPPVQLTVRVATEDIELPSTTLAKGKSAILLLGSANRDEEQFPKADRLDIGRAENRHLAFGMGIHFCLGAPLARVEGQVAIGEMVRRFPKMRLLDESPPYKPNFTLRGLASLPVGLLG
jgi:cytochrome P450